MTRSIPNLTQDDKNKAAQFLMKNSKNGVVLHGKIREAADLFGCTRRTIHYIWQAARQQVSEGMPVQFKSNKQGKPHKKHLVLDVERMKSLPFEKRTTIRRLERELEISKSHVGRWVKDGVINAHTNAIKPELTVKNKLQRLKFSLNALEIVTDANKIKFSGMYNVVHIDEKWFYMSRASERYYTAEGEEGPHRTCKSKKYIPKIMFMCAVSRPQYACNGQLIYDGKIGIFPLTERVPAKRNSKNRPKGTMITKPIASINKVVIQNCLVNQIIPAIKARWPANASKNIMIQQDNAKPHINNNDPAFREAASSDGFNIMLVCQPPNSPDTNILDLGFFRVIQSLQVETASYNVDQLVTRVLQAYQELTAITLNNVFLSLQQCLVEIMKCKGDNSYKLQHMGKARLLRDDNLPTCLEVEEVLVRGCIEYLVEQGQIDGSTYDIGSLMLGLGY